MIKKKNLNILHEAETQYLFYIASALYVFRSYCSAKCAGDRKSPPGDSKDGTSAEKR